MHFDSYLPSFSWFLEEFFITQFVDNLEQRLSLSERQESSRGMISSFQAFYTSVRMKNLKLTLKWRSMIGRRWEGLRPQNLI